MLRTPFHAAHAIAMLDRCGLTLDILHMHYGDQLLTDRGGNGDTYYEWQQVMDYYQAKANVPVG